MGLFDKTRGRAATVRAVLVAADELIGQVDRLRDPAWVEQGRSVVAGCLTSRSRPTAALVKKVQAASQDYLYYGMLELLAAGALQRFSLTLDAWGAGREAERVRTRVLLARHALEEWIEKVLAPLDEAFPNSTIAESVFQALVDQSEQVAKNEIESRYHDIVLSIRRFA